MKETIKEEWKKTQVKRRVKKLKEELTKAEKVAEQSDSMMSSVNENDKLTINK
jgi:hypothetical protein